MNRELSWVIMASALLALSSGAALGAGNASAGKGKSEDCGDCHGPDGRGDGDTIPAIAGMPAEKFMKAFEDFANGTRNKSKMMTKQGKKLSAQDVEDLAAYYAKLKP
jgi:cytochrome c553